MCRASGNVLLLINYFRLKLMNISLNQTYRRWIIVSITNIIIAFLPRTSTHTHTRTHEWRWSWSWISKHSDLVSWWTFHLSYLRYICFCINVSTDSFTTKRIFSTSALHWTYTHMAHATSNTSQSCISFRYTHYSFTHTHKHAYGKITNCIRINAMPFVIVFGCCALDEQTHFFLLLFSGTQSLFNTGRCRRLPFHIAICSRFSLHWMKTFTIYRVDCVDAKILHVHLS